MELCCQEIEFFFSWKSCWPQRLCKLEVTVTTVPYLSLTEHEDKKNGLIWPTMSPETCLYLFYSHTFLIHALENNWQNTPDFMTESQKPCRTRIILSLYWSYRVLTDKSSFLALNKAAHARIYTQQEGRKWNWTLLCSKPLLPWSCGVSWWLQWRWCPSHGTDVELCAILLMVHAEAWGISSEVVTCQNLVIPPEWEKAQSWPTASQPALTWREEPIKMLRLQLLKLSATTLVWGESAGCRNKHWSKNETGHKPLSERNGRNQAALLHCTQGWRNLKKCPSVKATCNLHGAFEPESSWYRLNSADASREIVLLDKLPTLLLISFCSWICSVNLGRPVYHDENPSC